MEIELSSVIICPHCHASNEEEMPQNACQYFYECKHCKTLLKPQKSDCCELWDSTMSSRTAK